MILQSNRSHATLMAAWRAVPALLARLLAMLHRDEKEGSSPWKARVHDIWP